MPTTVTTRQQVAVSSTTHTHIISLHGLSGWIFWCTLIAIVAFIIGFATVGWSYVEGSYSYPPRWVGLWMTCSSSYQNKDDWFRASQAMVTIGLVVLLAGAIACFIYLFVQSANIRKTNVIIAFTVLIFIAVVFTLIGLIVYGTNHYGTLHWSYALMCIAVIFSFIAGILAIVQMKQSNVF